LEEALTEYIESFAKEKNYRVEVVALILEMASTPYETNVMNDSSGAQLNKSQIKLREIASGPNEQINEYLALLQRKGLVIYYEREGLCIPTDRGMHFLQIYHMLASLLI